MTTVVTVETDSKRPKRPARSKRPSGRGSKPTGLTRVLSPFLRTRMLNLVIQENLYDEVVIAKRLGLSQETVRTALSSMRDAWREENQELFELYMARQLSEIDAMKAAIFDWAIGRRQIKQIDPITKKTTLVTLPPHLPAIESMLKLMEREARLMGLDRQPLPAQIQSAPTTFDLTQLSDAELISLEVIHLKLQRSPIGSAPINSDLAVGSLPGSAPEQADVLSVDVRSESDPAAEQVRDRDRPIELTPVNGVYTNGTNGTQPS